jgi:hypothetical protein
LAEAQKGDLAVVITAIGGAWLILPLAGLVISIWALVDTLSRPEWAWQASGQNKVLWIILNIVGFFICGLVIGLIYLIAIRPKVAAAQSGGGGGAGRGYPGGYDPGFGSGGFDTGPGSGWGGGGSYGADAPPGGNAAAGPPPPGSPPPGWYPDPDGSGQLRYWNGSAWTSDVRPQ